MEDPRGRRADRHQLSGAGRRARLCTIPRERFGVAGTVVVFDGYGVTPASVGLSVTGGTATRHADWRPPAALSVADARVREAAGATLTFAVTLNRASPATVTVNHATSDAPPTAGADYEAKSGTLTFSPGDTSKSVVVNVLDDAHDEGEETLTLTLSNASGGVLTDAQATGTTIRQLGGSAGGYPAGAGAHVSMTGTGMTGMTGTPGPQPA